MNNMDGGGTPKPEDQGRQPGGLLPEAWAFQTLSMLQTGTARSEQDPGLGGGPTAMAGVGFPLPHLEPEAAAKAAAPQPAPAAQPKIAR